MMIKSISKIKLDKSIPVYDVVNATPYNNFLICTNDNRKIVSHNCAMLDEVSFKQGANVQMEKSKIMETYNCLGYDTIVRTTNGNFKIGELVDKECNVYTVGKKYYVKESNTVKARKTAEVTELISIELDDGTILKVTPNHKLMLANGEYKEAKDLTENDILMEEINEDNVFDLSIWEQFEIKDKDKLNAYLDFIKEKYYNPSNSDCIEYHHILPVSFMCNTLTVALTPSEHFEAHKMLIGCFNGLKVKGYETLFSKITKKEIENEN